MQNGGSTNVAFQDYMQLNYGIQFSRSKTYHLCRCEISVHDFGQQEAVLSEMLLSIPNCRASR